MIYVKIHDTDDGKIIAMCDDILIGKVLEDGDLVLDLKDYSDFYVGDLINPKDLVINPEEKFNSANVVGNESVALAIEKNIIKRENVKEINSVPYAHAYWLNID